MEVRATAKGVRVSPQKVGLLLDLIRGKEVGEALATLRFLPSPTARVVAEVVKSAAANAENNFQLSSSSLSIVKAYADKGGTLKRFRPKARGRVNPILKRSTHITIIVAGE
ncbi:MAG: 50S ribosomal protein L22 [Dehalococcoidia bacterium]|nr:50S ribosomal protein L22 [Dehalococcoidia bacterium]